MSSSDRNVLVVFYRDTGGPQWRYNDGWDTSVDISSWYGVIVQDGRVVKLSLRLILGSNNLRGSIPKELGQLSFLEELVVRFNNSLEGPIPKELAALRNLKLLDLSSNQLTGPIPKELAALRNLKLLDLSSNQLTGSLPKELGQVASMSHLNLSNNKLGGYISKDLGKLSSLRRLDLSYNQLTGLLPEELGQLTFLTHLNLSNNKLDGSIPKGLGQLRILRRLELSYNKLTGSIPKEMRLLSNLKGLYIINNQLTGFGRGEDARSVLDHLARGINVSLEGNPWECPPASVVRKGIDWMKKYYDELERADPVLIDTRKVVFIGESGAGKTSLMKSIMAGEGQLTLGEERETMGVSVQSHVFVRKDQSKGTDVRFYDLAGQVEYYGLHQLFLTETALYVLVWDAWKYRNRTEELVEHLNNWLTTLHMRAPKSTVLLCATHKDKCVAGNLLTKALARLKGSLPLDEMFKCVEKTIRDKHEQWKIGRRTGPTRGFSGVDLKLERGIELVSSSPSVRHGESGLPNLKTRLENCGKGVRSLIPQSWSIALVVLDALRDGVHPKEAAQRYMENGDSLGPVTAHKHFWVSMNVVNLHWKYVVDKLHLNLTPDEQEFVLENVLDLRESGGSLLRHPEVVFLDVEDFALSLAPILNHKTHEQDGRGTPMFAGRKLDSNWMLGARTRLVSKGILEARFARFLWYKDSVDLPPQTFDVLVKMGILLPLPERSVPSMPHVVQSGFGRFQYQYAEEYLVLMRRPLNAPDETMQRFSAFKELEREWGVVAKWQFDYGSVPHGLVERLVASCHVIGKVVAGTYWRRGACFVAHEESMNAAGGSFALALQFNPGSENLNLKKAGTLVVQAFGDRDGLAIWGALRLVISSAWRLFEEFPGLGWEAWVECPTHVGQLQHYLAGVSDTQGKSPGDQLVRRGERPHCACQRGVGSRLGTVLEWYPSWAEIFESPNGDQNASNSDRDNENRFKRGLDEVLNATQELSTVEEPVESTEGWSTPEWLKDASVAGPAGALTLYETWSPLLKVADHWREGAFEKVIPLTIFAVFLAVAVFWLAFVGFRRLRLKRGWWLPRGCTKDD